MIVTFLTSRSGSFNTDFFSNDHSFGDYGPSHSTRTSFPLITRSVGNDNVLYHFQQPIPIGERNSICLIHGLQTHLLLLVDALFSAELFQLPSSFLFFFSFVFEFAVCLDFSEFGVSLIR